MASKNARLPISRTAQGAMSRGGLTAEDMKHCRWLRPRLVGAFEFMEWTPAGHLRHPKFAALRDDKKARDVIRDRLASQLPRRDRSSEIARSIDGCAKVKIAALIISLIATRSEATLVPLKAKSLGILQLRSAQVVR